MNYLEKMTARKRLEIRAMDRGNFTQLQRAAALTRTRDFKKAIRQPGRISIVAELKKRSPSRGLLRKDFEPSAIARVYEEGGVRALSVLTDREFFGGAMADLESARRSVNIPVMRKDFIIDGRQIAETRAAGADSLLLIARVLDGRTLADFIRSAKTLGMNPLVEVHDESDLDRALCCGAEIIGVNNRDLEDMSVDLNTALKLRPRIPERCVAVCESGIKSRADVRLMEDAGFDAILVGEALMTAPDIPRMIRELTCDP